MTTRMEERFWSKVDKTDGCWLWTGSALPLGYGLFGDHRYAHRVSYELANGAIPAGLVIDHICHVPACVNPDHLRAATVKQNAENRIGPNVNSTSGVRGVTWNKHAGKWQASVGHRGERVYVGIFADLDEAAAAVAARRKELFTHDDI